MIGSVLVANRGEIACRIFRTCRELGISTVAVYSDADAGALHVREADTAVRLPGAAPADTYLRGELVVKAALAAGADAVHPGYGFLSENAGFARAVRDAGLNWIGPPPEAIEAMASKTRAKQLMGLAPLDVGKLTEADLPVLVKAAAGGGGRGMRIVRELAQLEAESAAARAEALSAFGDGEVFVEPYVEGGRHVEVQILADTHGTVWTLGTRDCSLQRRHQKVVEEAPAPGLTRAVEARMRELAVRAARSVSYVGAGTVEFLVAGDDTAHFLEMNTRLQVEHPVTEAVFGIDLVELQLRVAEGEALPAAPPPPSGHAVEARLYAEDPAAAWTPQTGTLHRFEVPGSVRVDTGFTGGDTIGVHYDAMLAKVVAYAPTRAAALRKLSGALERARLHGPVTNRDLLVRALRHPEFAAGGADTGFFDRNLAALVAEDDSGAEVYAAVAVVAAKAFFPHPALSSFPGAPPRTPTRRSRTMSQPNSVRIASSAGGAGISARAAFEDERVQRDMGVRGLAPGSGKGRGGGRRSLWTRTGAWRNLPSQPQLRTYEGTETHRIRYFRTRTGLDFPDLPEVRLMEAAEDHIVLEIDNIRRDFHLSAYGDGKLHVDTPTHTWTLTEHPRFPEPETAAAPGDLLAPMPGAVVRLAEGITEGAHVRAGQNILWLEAMKMEHRVTAPVSGTLTALHATPGRQVEPGALLAVVQPEPADAAQPASADAVPPVQPVPEEEQPS
ncbi:acetyl/propionyl/methylcrotonyl-CoA carboxylase subunit alpha [Streptomyces sp. KLOTTS4A1]|uniref:acetyl/propionyl/methylcrotonyl-CoA carboxylase subunit alpha n=1 Tax=Streptomyces sp. KLOTTS4A1 TaxID=3390996 RepID=UPI0039F5887A